MGNAVSDIFLNGTIACIMHFGDKKILIKFHPKVQIMENLRNMTSAYKYWINKIILFNDNKVQ